MRSVRLLVTFTFHHCEIPAGTVISVPAALALELSQRGVVEMAEPERAVVGPAELRNVQNTPERKSRVKR